MFDFRLSEEQQLIQRTVRDFLANECPRTRVREIEAGGLGYDPRLYAQIAGLGWLGFLIPEEYGGSGLGWVDTAVYYEECGRALFPCPHWASVVLAGQALLRFGTAGQKERYLPAIARGEAILSLAYAEPESSSLTAIRTSFRQTAEGFILSGAKRSVAAGHLASPSIVVAKSMESDACGLFLVSPHVSGVTHRTLRTLSEEPVGELSLDDVRVGPDSVLTTAADTDSIEEIIDSANLLRAAEMVGGAGAAMDLAVDYAKFRVAFGRPIGAFQALQHKMANMVIDTDCARVITYYAAWLTDQGLPASAERAMAQFQAGQAYRTVTSEATQVFGGMGVMRESDIALYFRHAKALQLSMGPADLLRERMLAPLNV